MSTDVCCVEHRRGEDEKWVWWGQRRHAKVARCNCRQQASRADPRGSRRESIRWVRIAETGWSKKAQQPGAIFGAALQIPETPRPLPCSPSPSLGLAASAWRVGTTGAGCVGGERRKSERKPAGKDLNRPKESLGAREDFLRGRTRG